MSSREAKKQFEQRRKQREKERAEDREQRRLEKAFNADGQLSEGWLKEILGTDDIHKYLDEYELRAVRGMINRQWVLANLTEAQVHDRWYKLEVMKYKILGRFPPDESAIQGEVRAFLYDDKTEQLSALTAQQRNAIDQIILSLQNMVSRSKDGEERRLIDTNIARTEREETEGDDGGGAFGLFS